MAENPPRNDVEEQVLEDQKLVNERKDHIGKVVREHKSESDEETPPRDRADPSETDLAP